MRAGIMQSEFFCHLKKNSFCSVLASLVYIAERRHAIGIMRPHFCRKYGKIHTSIRST
jgi:hypothetical protein